ncbi:hypothetical protein GINT2_001958 [Glugoides intestinalis]
MIEILLDKQFYFPTQKVEGKIQFKIAEQQIIKSLKLRFYKKQRTLIKKTAQIEQDAYFDHEKTVRDSIHGFCDNCELSPGLHIFPFNFILRFDENGTGKCKGYFDDALCEIENTFVIQGIYTVGNDRYTVEKEVSIFDRSQVKLHSDIKITINSFLCFFRRTVLYRIQTDKLWYFKGDQIVINCFPNSSLKRPLISGITGKIYQIMAINNGKDRSIRSRHLLTANGFPVNKNKFTLQFRIPMNVGPSITEEDFYVKTILIVDVQLFNGVSIKTKKVLNIGQLSFEVPEIEQARYVDGIVFATRALEY